MIIHNVKTTVRTRDLAREMVKSGQASKMFDNGKEAGKKRWSVLMDKTIARSPSSIKGLMSKRHHDFGFVPNGKGFSVPVMSKRTKLATLAKTKTVNWAI